MLDSWKYVTAAWTMVSSSKLAPWLGGLAFLIALLAFGAQTGFTNEQIFQGVLGLIILAVFLLLLSKMSPDRWLNRLLAWGFGLLLLYGSIIIVHRYVNQDEPRRVPYNSPYIDVNCGSPGVMLTQANFPVGSNHDLKQIGAQNKIWEWVRDGLDWYQNQPGPDGQPRHDDTTGAVVVVSKSAFSDRHLDIKGAVRLNSNIKIEEGVTFLRSIQQGRTVYRQMTCKTNITSDDNGATFTLYEPNTGEDVFMILRVRSKDGKVLSGDCDSYGLSLKVNEP